MNFFFKSIKKIDYNSIRNIQRERIEKTNKLFDKFFHENCHKRNFDIQNYRKFKSNISKQTKKIIKKIRKLKKKMTKNENEKFQKSRMFSKNSKFQKKLFKKYKKNNFHDFVNFCDNDIKF